MKNYQALNGHERVAFGAKDVILIRPYLAQVANKHPVFVSIASRFDEETVNLSAKQAASLDRSLVIAGLPSLGEIVAKPLFAVERSYRGSRESATRAIMCLLDQYQYGDWTHREDFRLIPAEMLTMEVRTSDGPYYFGFAHKMDLGAAEMGLDGVQL